MDRITASPMDLMRQAGSTAQQYLFQARDDIDGMFGAGYAQSHPELVGVFMLVCAQDFTTSMTLAVKQDEIEQHEISSV